MRYLSFVGAYLVALIGLPVFDEKHSFHGVHESQEETEKVTKRQSDSDPVSDKSMVQFLYSKVASLHLVQARPKHETHLLCLCLDPDMKLHPDHSLHSVHVGSSGPELRRSDGFPLKDIWLVMNSRFSLSLILVKAAGYRRVQRDSPPDTMPTIR